MERTIKFRGKRVDNGKWIQGYLFGSWEKRFILWGTTNDVPNMIEVIPETVGQYTGLKDKNGVEIYEGDILGGKNIDGFSCTFKVIWSDYRDGWLADNDDEIYDLLPSRFIYCEVIGNIYENPELLVKE